MIHRFASASKAAIVDPAQTQPSFRSDVERRETPIKVYDPDSADMAFAGRIAQEIIDISGAEVIIYPRTESGSYDTTWEEDADPTYRAGKHLKGYFAPQPLQSKLSIWGVDIDNQTNVIFCRAEIFRLLGDRMVQEDDIIEIPYNTASIRKKPDRYRVLSASDLGNFRYNWLYHNCVVENITGDDNIDITHK